MFGKKSLNHNTNAAVDVSNLSSLMRDAEAAYWRGDKTGVQALLAGMPGNSQIAVWASSLERRRGERERAAELQAEFDDPNSWGKGSAH